MSSHKTNIKKTWSILNNLLRSKNKNCKYPDTFESNGKKFSNKLDIANEFNKFFVNIGPKLANDIKKPDQGSIFDYLCNTNSYSMFLLSTDDSEIISIVNNMKNKFSKDCLGNSFHVIKKTIDCIAKPLSVICNKSFGDGIFPDNMKTAKVIPIFKSGEKNKFNNYRPVSILPQFSKILEKIFAIRLENFLYKHDIFKDCQYGFRPNRSTSLALIDLYEKITTNIDKSKYTLGIFIDLKKAFDTIDHNILLKKLSFYGIIGTP